MIDEQFHQQIDEWISINYSMRAAYQYYNKDSFTLKCIVVFDYFYEGASLPPKDWFIKLVNYLFEKWFDDKTDFNLYFSSDFVEMFYSDYIEELLSDSLNMRIALEYGDFSHSRKKQRS